MVEIFLRLRRSNSHYFNVYQLIKLIFFYLISTIKRYSREIDYPLNQKNPSAKIILQILIKNRLKHIKLISKL